MYDAWVGSHKSVDVGPYLEHLGVESRRDDRSGIVAAATSEVCHFARELVATDKSRYYGYLWQFGESLSYELVGEVAVKNMFSELVFCFDKFARVFPCRIVDECGNDIAAQTFAIADDGCACLWAEVANEIHSVIDGTEFFEETVNDVEESCSLCGIGDNGVDHVVMTRYDGVKLRLVRLVSFEGEF